ncbi:MAG: TetR/AcrR family transcriptional regulator [Deltaproteobacteria bacterium]|nr:TetR/AcrR family transcriptional regulator [Deltaproteobacteria bacterium]
MERRNPSNQGQIPKKADKNKLTKGVQTRQRILKAARRVFARHPYHAASIRMIASEADMEHGTIRYHFARKSDIFEEIVQADCEEIYQNNRKWSKETIGLGPKEGLSHYLDRFLECYFNDPEPLHMINQNTSQVDNLETIPGYHHLINMLTRTRESSRKAFPVEVDPQDFGRYNDTFNALVINYVGASSLQAGALGVKPDSSEYRKWVKDTLMFIMVPAAEKMMQNET